MISLSLVFCRCFPHSERSEFVRHALDRRGWAHQVRISFREEAPITVTVTTSLRTISCVTLRASQTSSRASTASPSRTRQTLAFPTSTSTRTIGNGPRLLPFGTVDTFSANERRTLYRQYLVQHELGHCLGKHHPDKGECDDPDLPCKTMCQQSRSECYADPWNNSKHHFFLTTTNANVFDVL